MLGNTFDKRPDFLLFFPLHPYLISLVGLCNTKRKYVNKKKEICSNLTKEFDKEREEGPNLRILPKVVSWSAWYFWQTFGTRSSMELFGKMLFGQSMLLQ